VAGDHHFESCGLGFQVQLRQVVQHIDGNAAQFNDLRFGEFARPRSFVDVASDGGYGRKRSELLENLRLSDVSGVNNVIAPTQCRERLGTKQAVSVGDNADPDGGLSSQLSSCEGNS
jgi:hypothetical protein